MPKLVLISSENFYPNKIQLVEKMMAYDTEARFHLRKPSWSKEQCADFLNEIDSMFHSRISIHQFHDLQAMFPQIGLHFKESDRKLTQKPELKGSTSFHSEMEAKLNSSQFEYFFCSPVFTSISKMGYSPNEDWNLNEWNSNLREKAFALGGIDIKTISKAKDKGFNNVAVLGAIWMSKKPFDSFKEISELCQK